jgi:NADH dehydrogenase
MDVAVVGATGFVGRHVVERLAAGGHRVRAISRMGTRRAGWGRGVISLAADVETGRGIGAALTGADGVVHLAAIPRETDGRRFSDVNVEGVRCMVEAARAAGVRRFVHVSVLGVSEDPKLRYLHSKWRGEQIVRGSGLDWVILRPSLLFGEGDGFFNLVKVTLKRWSPGIVAIPGDGRARFQPLAVEDLAVAVERSLVEPGRAGSIIELGGPEQLTYREIVDVVMAATHVRRLKLGLPIPLLSALTTFTDRYLPAFPVSHDQIRSLERPNYTDRDAYERAFGVRPRDFDVSYLGRGA